MRFQLLMRMSHELLMNESRTPHLYVFIKYTHVQQPVDLHAFLTPHYNESRTPHINESRIPHINEFRDYFIWGLSVTHSYFVCEGSEAGTPHINKSYGVSS